MGTRGGGLADPCLCPPRQVIDDEMQKQERLRSQRLTQRSRCDDVEAEVGEVRKRLSAQQKECNATQKAIAALDTKLEHRRADRHSLLKACKVGERGGEGRRGGGGTGTAC